MIYFLMNEKIGNEKRERARERKERSAQVKEHL